MVRMQTVAWTFVAMVLLSGCSGGATPASTSGPSGKSELHAGDLGLDDSRAVIQGHVNSEELVPVPNATVGLRGTAQQDVTDDRGFYQFRSVPPGTYVVDVVGLGYAASAKKVDVVAGQISNVDFRLEGVEVGDAVYPSTIHMAGYLECAAGLYAFVAPCSYPYRLAYLLLRDGYCQAGQCVPKTVNLSQYGAPKDIQDNRFWLNFTVGPNAKMVIAELAWTPGSAAATQMQLFLLCGDFDPILNECTAQHRYATNTSRSPVRDIASGANLTKGCPSSKFCVGKKTVWFANDVAMPFNNPEFAFAQRFDVWDTVFYNGLGPVDFTVVPAG